MSNIIPDIILKDVFNNSILNKLKHKNYENLGYKDLIENNYEYLSNTKEYKLKAGIKEDVISEINFIFKRIGFIQFDTIEELSGYFRKLLNIKKYILLFAYNGTGKTRLSSAFKDLGKRIIGENKTADTLYYNAFTEDLFIWDNDLENDTQRVLKLNKDSRFFYVAGCKFYPKRI